MRNVGVKMNRNKIYEVGKKYPKLKQYNYKTLIAQWDIIKSHRRKNKVFLISDNDKITMVFINVNYAKKAQQIIKKAINNE